MNSGPAHDALLRAHGITPAEFARRQRVLGWMIAGCVVALIVIVAAIVVGRMGA